MHRIGIIGGTFDPPHFGHLIIAQEALESENLHEVWFLPVYIPPHKDSKGMSGTAIRQLLVEKAIKDHPSFRLCTYEIDRKQTSYTVDTMKVFVSKWPKSRFYFIIGGDMADTLNEWKDIDRLRQLVTFIVAKRPDHPSETPFDEQVIYIDAPEMNVSSTIIRNRVQKGKSIKYLVPESVRRVIEEKGLYGPKESP